jgi:hypothetical protein
MSRTQLAVLSVAVMLAVGIGVSTMAPANAQNMPSMPEGFPSFSMISGTYVNEEMGVEITFPGGWEGTEITSEGTLIVTVYQGGLAGASSDELPATMSLIVSDKESEEPPSSESAIPSEDSSVECSAVSTVNAQVAGVSAIQSVAECTVDGETLRSKTTIVETEQKWVMVGFIASASEYDANEGSYDSAVQTLEVNGAVDADSVQEAVEETVEETVDDVVDTTVTLQSSVQAVMIAGESVDVELRSSSTVSNFDLDEESKTISFTVDGEDGTEGTTEIAIGSVLEGPYNVMIDGEATSDFTVAEVDGETVLTVSYTHSTHEIAVTGTNVVPEFPIGVIGAVAAVIGIIAVMTRTKFAGAFRHQ